MANVKYLGINSELLKDLPPEVRLGYRYGSVTDEDIDRLLSSRDRELSYQSPADALATGPLTEAEEAQLRGYSESGGDDLSTPGAAVEAVQGTYRGAGRGIAETLLEGYWLPQMGEDIARGVLQSSALRLPPAVQEGIIDYVSPDSEGFARDLGRHAGQLALPQSWEDVEQRELDRAYDLGRQHAISGASDRAGWLGDMAIKAAPNLTSVGTSLAALAATRNPRLASAVYGASVADIGAKSIGLGYEEAITYTDPVTGERVYSAEEATKRARNMFVTEVLPELFNPVSDSVSLLKNYFTMVGTGAAQEVLAESGSMLADYAHHNKLAPADIAEVGARLGDAVALGGFLAGTVGGPGAVMNARSVRNERQAEIERFLLQDSAEARNPVATQEGTGTETAPLPVQPELDGLVTTPDMGGMPPDRQQELWEQEAVARVEEQRRGVERERQLDAERRQELRSRVLEDQAIATGRGSMAERLRDAGVIGRVTAKEPAASTPTTPAQPEPVQGTLPLVGGEAAPSHLEVVRKRVADKEAAAAKKADTKLNKWRTTEKAKIEEALLREQPDIAPDQFSAVVNLRLRAAEKAVFPAGAATVAGPSARPESVDVPTTTTTTTTTPDTTEAPLVPLPTKDEIAAVRKAIEDTQVFSLKGARRAGSEPTGVTEADLVDKFVEDESTDGYLFRSAIRSGKVKLAQDAVSAGIPKELEGKVQGVYVADTGEITIIPSAVKKDELIGTLLHEVTHRGIDRGESRAFRRLMGEEGVGRAYDHVNRLATSGNAVAQKAVDRYNSAKSAVPGTPKEELLAYFVTEAANARASRKGLGRAATLVNDMVSSVRVGAKELTGLGLAVNAKDLEYMARRELEAMDTSTRASRNNALQGPQPTPTKTSARPATVKVKLQQAAPKEGTSSAPTLEELDSIPEEARTPAQQREVVRLRAEQEARPPQVQDTAPTPSSADNLYSVADESTSAVTAPDLSYSSQENMGKGGASLLKFWHSKLPSGVRDLVTRTRGDAAAFAQEDLNRLNRLNGAIAATPDPKATIEALKDYEDSATREERITKAERLKSEYPQVFDMFNKARQAILMRSNEILSLATKLGYPLTAQDRNVIQSIYNSLGNYLTESYAAFGPRKSRKAHRKFLDSTEKGAAIKKAVKDWALSTLFNFNDLGKQSTDNLRVLYDSFATSANKLAGSSEVLTREELLTALAPLEGEVSDLSREAAAGRFVEDLLKVGRAAKNIGRAAAMYRSGVSQDMTILTPKNEVPDVIRKLWGQQENPLMNVYVTLVRQGELIARMRNQISFREKGMGTYVFPNKMDVPGDNAVEITGKTMGALQGLWTTPEVADYLTQEQQMVMTYSEVLNELVNRRDFAGALGDLARTVGTDLGRVGGLLKWASVVTNLANWVINYVGSPLQLFSNGNFTFRHGAKAHAIAFRDMPGVAYKDYTPEYIYELLEQEILDSSLAGEIKSAETRHILENLKPGADGTFTHSRAAKLKALVTDHYSGTDVWAKVANYEREKDFLRDTYKANGTPLSDKEIENMAGSRIRKTNFSYSQAWAPAQMFERGGLTSFLVYMAEVMRTIPNNMILGLQDISKSMDGSLNTEASKRLRTHGLSRVIGSSLAAGGFSELLSLGSWMLQAIGVLDAGDEDEERIRQGVSSIWDNMELGLIGKKGVVREYLDLSRFDPYGPLGEIKSAVLSGDGERIKEAVLGMYIWNKATEALVSSAGAVLSDKDIKPSKTLLSNRAPEVFDMYMDKAHELGVPDNLAKAGLRTVESILPRTVVTATMEALNTAYPENAPPTDEAVIKRLWRAAGGNTIIYDPRESLKGDARFGYAGRVNSLRREWSNYLQARKEFPPEEIGRRFYDTANQEFEAWTKLRAKVEAAKLVGLPVKEIKSALSKSGLSAEQVDSVIRGKFTPTVLSTTKLNSDRERVKEGVSTAKEGREVDSRFRKLERELAKLKRNYKPYEED